MIGLGHVYVLAGLVFAASAVLSARDATNPKRWVNAAFWGLLALSMLAGDRLGDLGNGVLVIALVLVAALGGLGRGASPDDSARRQERAARHGNRLFLLALVIPVTALVGTWLFKAVPWLVDAKQVTLVSLALGALLALLIGLAWLREKPVAALHEGRRLLDAVGWAAILPQMLASLGVVFALAGLGKVVGGLVSGVDFDATASNANGTRTNILSTLKTRRDELFNQVWQYVAYGVARVTDTSLLETQARATIQSIHDQSSKLTDQLTKAKADADSALSAIRAVASEHGVSQQAIYFKDEAHAQETLAETWLGYTYRFALAVGVFAVISLFLHKIEWLRPVSTAETLQLVTSKVLIFAVLGYMLVLAARNYATHKHNAIVNRHRQNALLTYRALVEAAADGNTQDIVLAHAASCIFSPQETGFAQVRGDSSPSSKSVLELLTKGASRTSE